MVTPSAATLGEARKLKEKFPHVSEEKILEALKETGGHAGKAFGLLLRQQQELLNADSQVKTEGPAPGWVFCLHDYGAIIHIVLFPCALIIATIAGPLYKAFLFLKDDGEDGNDTGLICCCGPCCCLADFIPKVLFAVLDLLKLILRPWSRLCLSYENFVKEVECPEVDDLLWEGLKFGSALYSGMMCDHKVLVIPSLALHYVDAFTANVVVVRLAYALFGGIDGVVAERNFRKVNMAWIAGIRIEDRPGFRIQRKWGNPYTKQDSPLSRRESDPENPVMTNDPENPDMSNDPENPDMTSSSSSGAAVPVQMQMQMRGNSSKDEDSPNKTSTGGSSGGPARSRCKACSEGGKFHKASFCPACGRRADTSAYGGIATE